MILLQISMNVTPIHVKISVSIQMVAFTVSALKDIPWSMAQCVMVMIQRKLKDILSK